MSPNHPSPFIPLSGLLALIALPLPLAADISVELASSFTNLDPLMPASFEVGQQVDIAFNYHEDSPGAPSGDLDFFFNAVTGFSFDVPEVGFSMSGGTGDIIRDATGRLTFTLQPLIGAVPTFEGQQFELVEMVLFPGTISVASSGLPASLTDFTIESFQVQFIDPVGPGTGRSAGQLQTVPAPEPTTTVALFGLTALALGLWRRRRRV